MRWAVVMLAVVACAGDAALPIDACVDGRPLDGNRDAEPQVCEPSPPTPSQITTAGAVLGGWDLAWRCTQGCTGNRPGLTYARHADIGADAIAYSSSTCVRCALTHAAAPSLTGCVDVEPGADWDVIGTR